MDPHSRAPKKNTSHGNEVLPQDTTHLLQRPCYQRGSPCQDPAGNRTTRRPPDDRKETQTVVVWTCLPFIGSGQNHLARHSERGKKTRQTGRKTTSGNGQAGSSASPRGQWRTEKNVGNWQLFHSNFHLCFRQTQYVDLSFRTDTLQDVENTIFTGDIGSSPNPVNGSITLWPVLPL